MSYSVAMPCTICAKCKSTANPTGECTDYETLMKAVTDIHSTPFEKGHQGAGTLAMVCYRFVKKEE